MKVILLDKIARLGDVGTEVEVKAGYARNYLLPQNLAVLATKENRVQFEARRQELEAAAAAKLAEAQALAERISEVTPLVIGVQAGTEGRLFGAVTNRDISEVLDTLGITVPKQSVRIPSGVIREVGNHTVVVHLHSEVNVEVPVEVQAS